MFHWKMLSVLLIMISIVSAQDDYGSGNMKWIFNALQSHTRSLEIIKRNSYSHPDLNIYISYLVFISFLVVILFLAVQDNSIGDIVNESLINQMTLFDFSVFFTRTIMTTMTTKTTKTTMTTVTKMTTYRDRAIENDLVN